MSEISVIFLYFYSLIIWFEPNVGIHTEIGKYWFSAPECGYGRDSQMMDSTCFDWHRTEQQQAMIRWGRHARAGEFPWIMELVNPSYKGTKRAECTVSIINRFWIITAAHCFDESFYGSYVYPVKSKLVDKSLDTTISVQYAFSHPKWKGYHYDLAVARLRKPIDLRKVANRTYRDLNAICFPRKYAVNKDYEHALLVGSGTISNGSHGKVWTGWTRMYPIGRGGKHHDEDVGGLIIRVRQLLNVGGGMVNVGPNGSATCSGDSGSPLVQFVNGRAVVVGILSGRLIDKVHDPVPDPDKDPDKGCGTHQYESIFARVSRFIDWIADRITLGERWAKMGYVQPIPKPPPKRSIK